MSMHQLEQLLHAIGEMARSGAGAASASKKIIGCFPGYAPEELVYAAGMVPVTMWHSGEEVSAAMQYFPSFYCGPVLQAMEAGMRGECDHYAGVIIAGLCDTLKAAGQNWKIAVPQVEWIPLSYPHHRKQDFGRRFLLTEYQRIRQRLGEISGVEVTDLRLEEAIALCNAYRRALRDFIAQAALHTDCITPLIRHRVLTAGLWQDRGALLPLVEGLTQALRQRQPPEQSGKRLLLSGIKLDSRPVLTLMERLGLHVVADDLLQESRQLRTDVPTDSRPPLERLADRWCGMEGCSLLYDPEKKRGELLLRACREQGVDGVVFCLPSFCDPEEYDYPLLLEWLQRENIPCLRLEQSSSETAALTATRLETFADILNR